MLCLGGVHRVTHYYVHDGQMKKPMYHHDELLGTKYYDLGVKRVHA
jgi:hypothetical protein